MKKVTTSELLKITTEGAEKRKHMYRNPKIVQVAMLVDVDEYGRIRAYSYPTIDEVYQLIDDSSWPFKPGEYVYHRSLKQVGKFIEVDQLDPSSASVEFVEEDGYKDEKRVSLALLTSDIPEEAAIVYESDNAGFYTKERVMNEIRQWAEGVHVFNQVPKDEISGLYEVIYCILMPRLNGVCPYTELLEFDEKDIQSVLDKFHTSSDSLIAKWKAAQQKGKHEQGTLDIYEMAGFYLDNYGENALKQFDEVMKHNQEFTERYTYWNRVRELISYHTNIR
jgi:hypothetical protein